jgi:hypothetical protein
MIAQLQILRFTLGTMVGLYEACDLADAAFYKNLECWIKAVQERVAEKRVQRVNRV